jgi:hypothetical protein
VFDAVAFTPAVDDGGAEATAEVIKGFPQLRQNCAPSGAFTPQYGHETGDKDAPHQGQKVEPSGTLRLQLGQDMNRTSF